MVDQAGWLTNSQVMLENGFLISHLASHKKVADRLWPAVPKLMKSVIHDYYPNCDPFCLLHIQPMTLMQVLGLN